MCLPMETQAETADAKKIIHMERMMEEQGVKCFIVMAANTPIRRDENSWAVPSSVSGSGYVPSRAMARPHAAT